MNGQSFWSALQRPFFTLAPLADVTDPAFRCLIANYSSHQRADGTVGGPDVMYTEFVSADGLVLADKEGREKLKMDLQYSEGERPIVAQLFSAVPEHMEKAAALCAELGFDGIDINMGCPDRSIEKQGAGAAMMKNYDNAVAVIEAAKRGAPNLPISVKTRLGYDKDELEEWLPTLLDCDLAAIAIHARTRKEMSKVPARWERVKRAVEIRDEFFSRSLSKSAPHSLTPTLENQRPTLENQRPTLENQRPTLENQRPTLILGNGDVGGLEEARERARASGADGVMLGRAIFGNPWLFHPEKTPVDITVKERLEVMAEHTRLFEELLPHKNFSVMKKHYKAYVHGFLGAKELRLKLMKTESAKDVAKIVDQFVHAS